jgi:hypothetical protein
MPDDPGATVVTNARAYYHYTRGCGCNGHPAFPTPSLGGRITQNSGAMRGENAIVCGIGFWMNFEFIHVIPGRATRREPGIHMWTAPVLQEFLMV